MSLTKHAETLTPVPGKRWVTALAAVAICAVALAFRVRLLDLPPVFDEYYHLLAAQGWLETGRPTILDGEYTRVTWFTRVVAWLFEITGSATLETGRLVAVSAGILIPPVLFLWLRARAGWSAALIGAGLAILWPQGIEESQILRFYSWQTLAFLVGGIAAFEAGEARAAKRIGWSALALIALGVALYLQITTAIGIVAILVWIGAMVVLPAIWRHPARWPLFGGLVLAGLVVIAILVWSGTLADYWARYRWSAAWNAHRQNEITYYSKYLRGDYPVFWPLLPLAALLGYRQLPRFTAYCFVVFGIILVAQSFGGMKAVRYLSYGMPFFFAVLAVALAAIVPAATAALVRAADLVNPTRFRWISAALVVVAVLFAALINPFFGHSLDALGGRPPSGNEEPDWTAMPDMLGEWEDAPFRMTMRELHTIAALGDYDVVIGTNRLDDFKADEFFLDPRTGRPMVDQLDSVAAIVRCEPEGLLLADGNWWGDRKDDYLALFDEAGREVEIRTANRLFALHWSGGAADPASCEALPL